MNSLAEEVMKTVAEKKGVSIEELKKKKALISLSLNEKTIFSRRIDEDILIEALGLSRGEFTEILTPEDIKYQPIAYIKGKSSDFIIFNRYIFLGKIKATTVFRIWRGESYFDFYVEGSKNLSNIVCSSKRALYWHRKALKANRENKSLSKRVEAFSSLPGALLAELMAEPTLSKLSEPAEGSDCGDEADE